MAWANACGYGCSFLGFQQHRRTCGSGKARRSTATFSVSQEGQVSRAGLVACSPGALFRAFNYFDGRTTRDREPGDLSMRPLRTVQPLPRYVRRKWLKGQSWAYFFETADLGTERWMPGASRSPGRGLRKRPRQSGVDPSSPIRLMAHGRVVGPCPPEGNTRNIRLVGEDL